MKFDRYVSRGLDFAVSLASTDLDAESNIGAVAVALLQDESHPGHRPPIEVRPEDVKRLRDIAALLRDVFESTSEDEAMAMLNRILGKCGAQPYATHHDDYGWHMHFAPDGCPASDLIGATAAMSLSMLLCEYGLTRIGICDAEGCYNAYADRSRNNRKRYCSVQCTTRSSVAAHRRRAKQSV
jgi:predicted RNA-binding Zn ribbon-like protein